MSQLHNKAEATGVYDEMDIGSVTELSVELSALKVEKTANKKIWVKGELEYTIVVTNIDQRDPDDPTEPGLPVTDIILTDIIDTTIASLVTSSVKINGVSAAESTDFSYVGGVLTFLTLTNLNPGASHTITFQVNRAQP